MTSMLGLYAIANLFMILVIVPLMIEMKKEGVLVKHVLILLVFLPSTLFCVLMYSVNGLLDWVAYHVQKQSRSSRLLNYKLFEPKK